MTVPIEMTKECQLIKSIQTNSNGRSINGSNEFVSLLRKPSIRDSQSENNKRDCSSSKTIETKIVEELETKLINNMGPQSKIQSNQMIVKHNKRASNSSNRQTGNQSKQLKRPQKPRRRVATLAQRRAANIRERRRMYNLNSAFDRLRKKVPSFAYEKRLSRIETLKLAIMYIKFMDNLVNDNAYAEKYKQLTANTTVAQATSGFLSSSSYLSLYGPAPGCSSPSQAPMHGPQIVPKITTGNISMDSRLTSYNKTNIETSNGCSFNNEATIKVSQMRAKNNHERSGLKEGKFNNMLRHTSNTYSKSDSPQELYCSDNQCTQFGPTKVPSTCCPMSPTSSTSVNTCHSSLASTELATRDSASPNVVSFSPTITKQTNGQKQLNEQSPASISTSNNQSPASSNLFYLNGNKQDDGRVYHSRAYSREVTEQLLHQSSNVSEIYYGCNESSIKHSSVNHVGSIYYDLQPRMLNNGPQQRPEDGVAHCGRQDIKDQQHYYTNSNQYNNKETRSIFHTTSNNSDTGIYNLSQNSYSIQSMQQQQQQHHNPQQLFGDYQAHHTNQQYNHLHHNHQVTPQSGNIPSQPMSYVQISSLQEAK